MQNTPKSRLRHDNSQIQFAIVESSPITERDSQFLTEHQKEVRDRQKSSTALMFADIRSSPTTRAKDGKSNLPELILSSDLAVMSSFIEDGPHTPEHAAPTRGPMDRYLTSSPTPTSVPRRTPTPKYNESVAIETNDSAGPEDEFPEVPSSPPSVHDLNDEEKQVVDEPIPSIEVDVIDETIIVPSQDIAGVVETLPDLPEHEQPATEGHIHEMHDLPTPTEEDLASSSSPVRYETPRRTPETFSSPSDSYLPTRQLAAEFQDYVERTETELRHSRGSLAPSITSVSNSHSSLDEQAAPQDLVAQDQAQIGPEVFVDASQTSRSQLEEPTMAGNMDQFVGNSSSQPRIFTRRRQIADAEVTNTPEEAVTRVTNSFISPVPLTPTQASSDVEANSSANRKRKHSLQGNGGSIKKAKTSSPLKQFLSKMFGHSESTTTTQEETNGEEVLDCIVVASRPTRAPLKLQSPELKMEPLETPTKPSQNLAILPSSSRQGSQLSDASEPSVEKQGPLTRGRKRKSIEATSEPGSEANAPEDKEEQTEDLPAGKRRRGRSKKEEPPPTTETPERVLRSSKRLSHGETPNEGSTTKNTRRGRYPLNQSSLKAAAASPVVIHDTFPETGLNKSLPGHGNGKAA